MNTLIYLGSVFGKYSTSGGNIFINIIEKTNITTVPQKKITGFQPLKAKFKVDLYNPSSHGKKLDWNLLEPGVNTYTLSTVISAAINSRLPNTLTPAKTNNNPTAAPIATMIINLLLLISPVSNFMNEAINTGLITNATNKDELNVTIKVIGKNFINSPIIPGQNANGKKAANVVAVDAIIGQATSPTPCFVASKALTPSSINR